MNKSWIVSSFCQCHKAFGPVVEEALLHGVLRALCQWHNRQHKILSWVTKHLYFGAKIMLVMILLSFLLFRVLRCTQWVRQHWIIIWGCELEGRQRAGKSDPVKEYWMRWLKGNTVTCPTYICQLKINIHDTVYMLFYVIDWQKCKRMSKHTILNRVHGQKWVNSNQMVIVSMNDYFYVFQRSVISLHQYCPAITKLMQGVYWWNNRLKYRLTAISQRGSPNIILN